MSQFLHPPVSAKTETKSDKERAAERRQHLIDEIELTPVTSEHLQDLADLHYTELSWSLNGQLGRDHISELYKAIARSPHFFGYAYYNRGKLLGFATGTTHLVTTRSHVLAAYQGKWSSVIALLVRNPRFLIAALESKFGAPWIFRIMGASCEWLTLVTRTDQSYISPFVALRLIDAVRARFLAENVDFYVAQGYKTNPKAMKMYAALKWEVVARMLMHKIYKFPTRKSDDQ